MPRPEDEREINPKTLRPPDGGGQPSAGGGRLDTDFERIVPLASQYDLIAARDEEAQREYLLGRVTVDEHGIARSNNPTSKVTTSLVAVRIQGNDATIIPLELDGNDLVMYLPENTGSQIGFFVGHDGVTDMAAVLRQGEYPGIPLTTETRDADRQKEVMIGMGGIKVDEPDEARWAEQIALYDLGFNRYKTRGVFSKSHRPDRYTSTWANQRLLVLPENMRDLADHFDSFEVKENALQIMTYSTQPVREMPIFNPPDTYGRGYESLGGTRSPATKGLGVGFGNKYTQQASTTGIELKGLASAFQIKVAPRRQ